MTVSAASRPPRRYPILIGAVVGIATAIAVPMVLFSPPDTSGPGEEGRTRNNADLALGDLAVAAAPKGGYLAGAEFHGADSRVTINLPKGATVTEIARVAGSYLLSTVDKAGSQHVVLATDDGTVLRSWRSVDDWYFPSLVASEDRELGAFTRADGTVIVVEDQGRVVTELASVVPHGTGTHQAPVAVRGRSCIGADADCVVVIHAEVSAPSGAQRTWIIAPGQPAVPAGTEIGAVSAVARHGYTAGKIRIIDDGDGACSGVADVGGSILWETCQDRMISFSPNAELILATTSAYFGSGEHELTVFDADTGAERLRLKTADNVGIYEMVWEDDSHVLAVVSDWKVDSESGDHTNKRWAVLRIALDGSRAYAVEPIAGHDDDFDGPLDLALR